MDCWERYVGFAIGWFVGSIVVRVYDRIMAEKRKG
jgi:hypothetical protein